ncbi:MAG TPA: DNA polymerase IV, partial [Paenibacillaceae bacterium]
MSGSRIIMLADCQSFYASVEKAARPEYRDRPVVVAGDPARRTGIVLAACPLAKRKGVTTAERLGEALNKCPGLVVIRPRMSYYLEVAMQITAIFESYTDLVEPYSIDEQFLDVTGTVRLFGGDPVEMARRIQRRVLAETGVFCRFGIASSKVLAKMACDNYAKSRPDGLFDLRGRRLEDTLWKLPVEKMFMIGSRMAAHLRRMGIATIGDLAR